MKYYFVYAFMRHILFYSSGGKML